MSLSSRNIVVSLTANAQGFQQQMQGAVKGVQSFSAQAKATGPPLTGLNTALNQNSAIMKNYQPIALQAGAATGQFGQEADKAATKSKSFAEKFSGNKGMIFGMLGMVSAGAEAVGMWGMYGEAQKGVAEAQGELNKLTEEGITSGQEYNQAQSEVAKQNKWLAMTQRNLILSNFDMVFWSGMIVQGLSKQGGAMSKITGLFGKLKNAMHPTVQVAKELTYGLSAVGGASTGAVSGVNSLTAASVGLKGALLAAGLAIGIVVAGMTIALTTAMDLNAKWQSISEIDFSKQKSMFMGALQGDPLREAQLKETNKVLEAAGGASMFEQKFDWEAVIARAKKNKPDLFNEQGKLPLEIMGHENYKSDLNEMTRRLASGATIDNSNKDLIAKRKEQGVVIEDLNSVLKRYGYTQEQSKMITDKASSGVIDYTGGLQHMSSVANEANTLIGNMGPLLKNGTISLDQATIATEDYALKQQLNNGMSDINAKNLVKLTMSHLKAIAPLEGLSEAEKNLQANMKARLMTIAKQSKASADYEAKLAAERKALVDVGTEYFGYNTAVGMTNEQLTRFSPIIADVTKGIHEQETFIRDSENAWLKYAQSGMFEADKASQQFILTSIDVNEIMNESQKSILLQGNALIAGKMAVQEHTTATVLNNIANIEQQKILTGLIEQEMELPNWLKLSTEQLYAMREAMLTNGNAAAILAGIIKEKLNKHLEQFSGLISSENWKDFKKAWKDIDFGAIPKAVRGEFKEMFNDMRKVSEHGREMKTAFDMVISSIISGTNKVSSGDRRKVFKELGGDLDRIAKIDPEAKGLNDAIIKPLMKFKGEKFDQEVLRMSDTIGMLIEAVLSGNITLEDFNGIMAQAKIDTEEIIDVMTDGIPQIDKFGNAIGTVGKITKEMEKAVKKAKKPLKEFISSFSIGGKSLKDSKVPTTGGFKGKLASDPDMKSELSKLWKMGEEGGEKGFAGAVRSAEEAKAKIEAIAKSIAGIQVPPPNFPKYQQGLQLAIANAAQTVSIIATELAKIAGIQVPPPNETKYQQGLQLAIENANQTVKFIKSTLLKVSGIVVPAADQSKKYQKGLQLMINNAAQTVKIIEKELKKIAKISVPAPKWSSFKSSLSQAVSDTKSAVREINSALSNINKAPRRPSGLQNADTADIGTDSDSDSQYLGTAGSMRNMTNSVKRNEGPFVFHIHIHGNEIIQERTITKFVKKISGSNIPNMH